MLRKFSGLLFFIFSFSGCVLQSKSRPNWIENSSTKDRITLLAVKAKMEDATGAPKQLKESPEDDFFYRRGICIFQRSSENKITNLVTENPILLTYFLSVLRNEPETATVLKDFDATAEIYRNEVLPAQRRVNQIQEQYGVENYDKCRASLPNNQGAVNAPPTPETSKASLGNIAAGVGAAIATDLAASYVFCGKIPDILLEGLCQVTAGVFGFVVGTKTTEMLHNSEKPRAQFVAKPVQQNDPCAIPESAIQEMDALNQKISTTSRKIMDIYAASALRARENPTKLSPEKYKTFLSLLENEGRTGKSIARDGLKCEEYRAEAEAKLLSNDYNVYE